MTMTETLLAALLVLPIDMVGGAANKGRQMTTEHEIQPSEVHAIVGKLIELIDTNIACSQEVLIAALKIAATTIEETKMAQFSAQIRAGMLMQSRGKR